MLYIIVLMIGEGVGVHFAFCILVGFVCLFCFDAVQSEGVRVF